MIRTEDAQHLPARTGFRPQPLSRIVPQPKLRSAKRAKPGKKARLVWERCRSLPKSGIRMYITLHAFVKNSFVD
ncbi:MAG: hypothetical protein COW84_11400 [Gammaproteobacteria bacterium CG22_combo_CG10-13_8_21_14_all_40_8]|nr:MAG: hypothetical protein COW84_11400 [Gammaproteobacteria bacterium CG22_combo_CG10-13_8_21_14_all_40_8]